MKINPPRVSCRKPKARSQKIFSFVLALGLGLWAAGSYAETPRDNLSSGGTASNKIERGYIIGATNLVFIKILGQEALQETYRVDESGYITHPLLGRFLLGGKTVAQAEQAVTSALVGDYILEPNVTVFVLEHSRFSVLGEVRNPGNYEILGRLSIMEGISIAGGFTPVANAQKVNILRYDQGGEKRMTVNIRSIMDGKQNSIDIQAGDVIEVPQSFF